MSDSIVDTFNNAKREVEELFAKIKSDLPDAERLDALDRLTTLVLGPRAIDSKETEVK